MDTSRDDTGERGAHARTRTIRGRTSTSRRAYNSVHSVPEIGGICTGYNEKFTVEFWEEQRPPHWG